MKVTVNGHSRDVEQATTVAELVASQPKRSMAVAVNGVVIPQSAHATTVIEDGDAIEIVTAVAGG